MAFNLGTIESKVKVEGLAQFGDDLKRADATMDAFAQQTSRRFTRVETDIKAVAKSVGMSAQDMQGQLDRAMKSISADTATKSLERMARQMGMSKQEVVSFGQQMGLSAQTIENLTTKLAGAGSGMASLTTLARPLAGAVAGAFTVSAITGFIDSVADVKMKFEAFDRTLKSITGSQTGAAMAMESLGATSDRLGLLLTSAAEGYKLIGAAAKGTVLEGTAAKTTFEAVASSASVLGLSASDTNGILLALSQMISKGKVQAEELRGQLGERLPGAFQIAARAMGVTTAELDKMLSTGGLATDQFLPRFAAELQKTFGQGATEAGNSTQAAFNRMQNAWDQLKAALGDTTVFGIVIAAMNKTAAVANAVAQSIRAASGTLQGAAKVASLQARLDLLQGPDAVNAYGGPENYDPAKAKAEIEKVTKELAAARQDIEDAAQEQFGRSRQNAINKQYEQEQAAIKGGEQATLDAWAASADKKVALWANQQKEISAAYERAYKGEITQGAMDTLVDEANKKYAQGLEDLDKKDQKTADQAARRAEQIAGYLQQAQDQYDQLVAQLGGDSLGVKLAAIDKRYDAAGTAIRKSMIGATGPTDAARAALERFEQNRAIEILLAQIEAWKKAMQDAANMLSELGRLTGDPEAIYGGLMTAAQAWEADQAKRIGAIQDESERTKQLGELQQVMALKELEARRQAYSGMSAVSSKYWEAEKQTLEQHLSTVKANATDETAYRIYAAEQWDDYNKKLLEKQASYSGTFADTFAAKWSLAFGSYKSELTKAQDDFKKFSDDIIELSNGIADAISGGFGDAFRNIANGEFSLQNWSKNTLSRIVDSASGFLEKSVKSTFTDLFASFGAGASSESATTAISSAMASVDVSTATITIASATISGAGGMSGTDTLAGGSGSGTLGQDIGRSAGDSFTSQLSGLSSSSSDASLLFTSASDASELIGGAVSDKMSSAIWARNNNPGNIRSGSGFASYDSMQDGLNAMADLLKSYERRGYDTVNKIVSRYAPSSENNTAAYIASVSKEMGVGPNDRLYLTSDSDMLMKLQKAMTRIEGSRGALTDDMFYNATHAKQLGTVIGSSSGDAIVDSLSSNTSDLSMVIGNAPDIGESFAKASAQYGNVWDSSYLSPNIWDASSGLYANGGYSSWQSGSFANPATSASSGSKYNWGTATAGLGMAAGGVMGMLNAKTALGALGSGVMAAGGVMMMVPGLQVAGAITSAVGGIVSLFGQENKKEIKKVAEGYNIGVTGGMVNASGVDFYSDGSTVSTGVTDPDVVRKVSEAFKDAAKNVTDFSKVLGFSTKEFVKNFNFPSMNITGNQLDSYIRNGTNALAFSALDQAGLRGAFDAVAQNGEVYIDEFKRLASAYQTVGGYTEAYGYDLQTLAGITQDSIDALRMTNTEVAQGTLPAMLTMAAAMGATGDIMSVLASTATDTSVALNVTDEQLSKILQADYASQIEEAVGGEDAFKTIMGNLVKNTLDNIDAYKKQAVYYTNKSNEAFADLKDPTVTIDNFWSSFDAAMKKGLSVDDFEAWADASSWVNNFQTITDAIQEFYNTIEKLGQSLQARNYKALGMDTASSASTQIASNRWELYDAGKAGYDDATLASIAATQGAEVAKSLRDIFDTAQSALDDAVGGSKVPSEVSSLRTKFDDLAEAARLLGASEQELADIRAKEQATLDAKLAGVLTSVSDQVDDATRTDTEKWYSSLHKSIAQSIEDARALGASEQQLSDIRADEQTIIAAKLGDMMGDIREALSTYNGTELAYSVSSLKQEMAGKLYDAALMGASQADLTDVGTLYAYKVKAAYQTQIDTITSQLKTAADALKTFSASIKDFLDGLWTDSDVSPLTVTGQYVEAQRQWRTAAADLFSTNEDTKQAAEDKIQGLTTTYLKLSQQANTSASANYADFLEVQTVLGDSYKQAKTDHDLLQAQLDAATGTEDSTKTTAELTDQLKALQQQQGDTWTQMLTDLPKNIADALAEALGLKKTGASGGGAGGGGSSDLSYGKYGSADAWDAAYVAAEQSYLESKAAELNAAGTNGKTDWNVYDVAKSISDLGLTPYEHFFEYGSGEKNSSTGQYLSWGDAPTTAAPRNLSTGGGSYTKDDVIGSNLNIGSAFNEGAYLSNKVDQLNATGAGGRNDWTAADVTASLAGLGLTPAEHFAQYGQYEGVKPYATGGLVADLARSGGYLPGYSSVDDTLAMLKRGEFVFTQDAVRRWGLDTLIAMNSGNVRGFSDGGLVSPSPVSRPPYSGGSATSSSGNNDAEVKALRQEVAELKEIVRGMASDAKQSRESLDRIAHYATPN